MSMCECVYVSVWTYVYVSIGMYVYVHMWIQVYVIIRIYVYARIWIFVYVSMCIGPTLHHTHVLSLASPPRVYG